MDVRDLKRYVEKIEMPEDMQNRIIKNCSLTADRMEKITMKKANFNFIRYIPVAAIIALCVCVSVAAAAGHFGHFKDITNWKGAVVGTRYEQASNEIEVDAAASRDELTVTATLLIPDTAPYSEVETLGIGDYQIVDMFGNVLLEGESTDMTEIIDGAAEISVSMDGVDSGNYRLLVSSFVGAGKGEQPIEISGTWECDFTF